MTRWTPEMVAAQEAKVARGNKQPATPKPSAEATREIVLHREIVGYCHSQWPRWKVIFARPDIESTMPVGAQDLTIFLPGGRVLCVELKTKTGKQTTEQLSWAAEMRMIGHTVHVVRSMEEFHAVISGT